MASVLWTPVPTAAPVNAGPVKKNLACLLCPSSPWAEKLEGKTQHRCPIRAVPCLVTLRPLCKIFLRQRGLTQHFWWVTQVRFFDFWLRISHFGLVWLWCMIRQFRIHLNFRQNCCVHSRPLVGLSLRPTRNCGCCEGLKHGTECVYFNFFRCGL